MPHGRWKTTKFTAGLRLSGLAAPMVIDGPRGGDVLRAYVDTILVPELAHGDVLVMDHLPAHKVAGVRQSIEPADATLLYLPADPPDFNPIEMAFSKFKAVLRATPARTIPGLQQAIKQAIERFTPEECRNYFQAAGYNAF